ncbi:MAG: protein phosphatase 2C domain-containing protein [Planctomycetaceae bacterium]
MTEAGSLNAAESAAVFLRTDMPEVQVLPFAGGQLAVYTHRSPLRDTDNEDSAGIVPLGPESGVAVVADGVGGYQGGSEASSIAVRTIQQWLGTPDDEVQHLRGALIDAVENASRQIQQLGTGAATTLAMIDMQAGEFRPYHVGDSMILLFGQRGRIKWQSISHSPVGYAVEAGYLDEESAMSHPSRHLVSNVVGQPDMRIELGPTLKMAPRDTLVLCTDGLSDNVTTEEIVQTLRSGQLHARASALVALARQRMHPDGAATVGHSTKPDDLTVIAIRRK